MDTALKVITDLPLNEQMDIVQFVNSPSSAAIFKVLGMVVELQRDEAFRVPPEKREERLAKMDIAYAAERLYKDFKDALDVLVEKHFAEVQLQAVAKMKDDQRVVEEIVLGTFGQEKDPAKVEKALLG
jgi:hypothetical protein